MSPGNSSRSTGNQTCWCVRHPVFTLQVHKYRSKKTDIWCL